MTSAIRAAGTTPSFAVEGASDARRALGVPAPWRGVDVEGVRLAISDEGRGSPALVCLHAIGHGGSDFTALRNRLLSSRRVITLDWPGQGHSATDTVPPSAARYAELVAGVLHALGVDRAVLYGNSIGGAAAIRCAALLPERVRGLVLANPGGLDQPDAISRAAIAAMVRFFRAGAHGARWFPAAYALYYRMILQRGAAAAQRARIVAAGPESAPLLAAAWESFGRPDADLRSAVATLTCPILFAWAARDQLVQLRRSRATIRRLSHAELRCFPAGHAPHLETPAAFDAALDRFLSSID